MSQDPLDKLTTVFTNYMEPNEDGEPLVEYKLLPQLLADLDLPDLPFKTLDQDGFIEFERFINTLSPLLEDKANPPEEFELQKTIFYMLSRGKPSISPESLKEAMKPLGLSIPDQDLQAMCKQNGHIDKQGFLRIWRKVVQ